MHQCFYANLHVICCAHYLLLSFVMNLGVVALCFLIILFVIDISRTGFTNVQQWRDTELPSWACEISWVLINQSGYPHRYMVVPLNGVTSASGAIFRTTTYTVYAICKRKNHDAIVVLAPPGANFRSLWSAFLGFTRKSSRIHTKIMFFAEKYTINQIP